PRPPLNTRMIVLGKREKDMRPRTRQPARTGAAACHAAIRHGPERCFPPGIVVQSGRVPPACRGGRVIVIVPHERADAALIMQSCPDAAQIANAAVLITFGHGPAMRPPRDYIRQ